MKLEEKQKTGLVLLFITDNNALQLMGKTPNSTNCFMVSHKAQL